MKTARHRVSFLIATTCTLLSFPCLSDYLIDDFLGGCALAAPAKAAARGESLEAWTDRITKQVKQNWHPPQCNVSENTIMYCDIDASGKIVGTKLQKSSGVKALDESVAKAFADTGQVAPPPVAFPKGVPAMTVEITFDYKVQQQQAPRAATKAPAAKPAIAPAAAQTPALDTTVPAADTTAAPALDIPAASPPMEMPPAAVPETPASEPPATTAPSSEESSTAPPSSTPAAGGDPFEAK
jgi:TonB family protein